MVDLDAERFRDEPYKETRRGPFERDRARVLHSAGFRRLASKTQVHTAGTDDFLRTRLTHSLEVAQIAREMGERLGCDPDVVDVAGLAHDLGHPPFGHNGEDALNEVAQECGGFEGNAQTLRVVTRLEAKVEGAGLNLTRASLDAICKYPWPRTHGRRKFGVYADDLEVFDWFRPEGAGEHKCLEAQVMDWADDVAYSVHDVEDGFFSGFIKLDAAAGRSAGAGGAVRRRGRDLLLLARRRAGRGARRAAGRPGLRPARRLRRLASGADRAEGFHQRADRTVRGVGGQCHARGAMAGGGCAATTRTWSCRTSERARCALLKGIALRYVMRRRGTEPWYAEQRQILRELVGVLSENAPEGLDLVFAPLWKEAADDAARLRVVIDQVASLTDPGAVAWHRRLVHHP